MSDIFISYAREDESRIRPLVAAFEAEDWSVFWDRRIPAGSTWRSHIGSALQQARCVVVVWSVHSVESQWVAEEADDGKARQILVPVSLDAVMPPRGFREIQAADLKDWEPGQASENLTQLLGDMRRLLGRSVAEPPTATSPVSSSPPMTSTAVAVPAGHGWRNGIIAIAAAALVAIAGYLALGSDPPPPVTRRTTADAAPSRPPPAVEVAPAGEWLVVAGSFARSERRNADRRLMALAEAGFEARVIDSSEYSLLTPDLWVVALGPFESRATANAALERLKPRVPDAYLKKAR